MRKFRTLSLTIVAAAIFKSANGRNITRRVLLVMQDDVRCTVRTIDTSTCVHEGGYSLSTVKHSTQNTAGQLIGDRLIACEESEERRVKLTVDLQTNLNINWVSRRPALQSLAVSVSRSQYECK